jgi:hypothetical protein
VLITRSLRGPVIRQLRLQRSGAGNLGPVEEAAIEEEDAEAAVALDHKPIVPPSLGLRMREEEHAAFAVADPVMIRHEISRAAKAPQFTGFQVADAPHD